MKLIQFILVTVSGALLMASCGSSSSSTTTEASSSQVEDTGEVMQALNGLAGDTDGLAATFSPDGSDAKRMALDAVKRFKEQQSMSALALPEATRYSAAAGDFSEDCSGSATELSNGIRTTITCSGIESESYSCGGTTYTVSNMNLNLVADATDFSITQEGDQINITGNYRIDMDFSARVTGGEFSNSLVDCEYDHTFDLSEISEDYDIELDSCSCTVDGSAISCTDLESSMDGASCS